MMSMFKLGISRRSSFYFQSRLLSLSPQSHQSDNLQKDTSIPVPAKFISQSFRRVPNSPTLPLEAVSIPRSVQAEVHALIKHHRLSARHVRKHVKALSFVRAQDFFRRRKSVAQKGQPHVQPPLKYTDSEAVSYTALRMPATLAANIYVMAEIRRCLPNFAPSNILDFGAGAGVSVMAATRSFPTVELDQSTSSILEACLIDHSSPMLKVGQQLLRADPNVSSTNMSYAASPNEQSVRGKEFDIVCASYSLNEIVRNAMANPQDPKHQSHDPEDQDKESGSTCRENRARIAEKMLRRMIKSLWSRTKMGGIFVVVEDGTAAGFETISFVRDTILNLHVRQQNLDSDGRMRATANEEDTIIGKVIAPCLHSRVCPLKDSITRRRVCRFQQRLNRPLFSRNADPLPTGYEDEYFSFIVIQKITQDSDSDEDGGAGWGRLIRAPLMKGKHIALDVCTKDGILERRVVSKKSARPGHFSQARRSKWGDIWPDEPSSKPQALNF